MRSASEAFPAEWRRPRKAADFGRCQLETYEKLLEAFGEHRAARLTYDQGVLEFMVPWKKNPSDLIGLFIVLGRRAGLESQSLASTTWSGKIWRGSWADKCYYIQNELVGSTQIKIRPQTWWCGGSGPTPHWQECSAKNGDTELWRYDGKALRIYQLQMGKYQR